MLAANEPLPAPHWVQFSFDVRSMMYDHGGVYDPPRLKSKSQLDALCCREATESKGRPSALSSDLPDDISGPKFVLQGDSFPVLESVWPSISDQRQKLLLIARLLRLGLGDKPKFCCGGRNRPRVASSVRRVLLRRLVQKGRKRTGLAARNRFLT